MLNGKRESQTDAGTCLRGCPGVEGAKLHLEYVLGSGGWPGGELLDVRLMERERSAATVLYQGASFWSRAAVSHCTERLTAWFIPGSAGKMLYAQHNWLGSFPPGQFSSSGGAVWFLDAG